MRILVVGGTGMIGHYLVPRLLSLGDEVTVLSRGNRPADRRARRLIADRRDPRALREALRGESFDAVIDDVAYAPEDFTSLLSALLGRIGHYVLTSTAFVYPAHDAGRAVHAPLREEDWDLSLPPLPADATGHQRYVDGKRRLETLVSERAPGLGIMATIVRPHLQLAGAETEDGRFAWFWLRVRDGGPIWLPARARGEDGPCQMAFAGDVAEVLALAARREGAALRVYNASSGETFTYPQYVALLARTAGTRPEVRYAPRERLDRSPFAVGGTYLIPLPYVAVTDVSRAAAELGARPTPLPGWIPEVGEWVEEHYRGRPAPPWLSLRAEERAAAEV